MLGLIGWALLTLGWLVMFFGMITKERVAFIVAACIFFLSVGFQVSQLINITIAEPDEKTEQVEKETDE